MTSTTQIPIFQSFSAQLVVTDIQVKVKLQLKSRILKHVIIAKMYRRDGNPEDPWISLRDHADPTGPLMMYGGNSDITKTDILEISGGMRVYIR